VKAVLIGSDCRLGLELAASLQGRDLPFVSISSKDPVLEGSRLLEHAFAVHGATQVVNLMSREWFASGDPALAKRSLLLVKNLSNACRARNAALLHVSDDSMFAGRRSGAYREKDAPDRRDEHALRVLHAENHVIRRTPRHLVLRTGPLIASQGDNLFTRVMRQLERGEPIDCTDDKLCPTPAVDLARVIVAIILQLACGASPWGVYHYCSSDAVSLYNFAEAVTALASQYGRIRRESVQLRDIHGQERHVILNCHPLLGAFGIKQRAWRAALPSVVSEYCR